MSKKQFNRQKNARLILKSTVRDLESDDYLVISLKYLNRQGQSFTDWESVGLLSRMMGQLFHYCQQPMKSVYDNRFIQYPHYPSNSKFTYPSNISPDVQWARIKIMNKPRVIGYVFRNIFYIVFLDMNHEFMPTTP